MRQVILSLLIGFMLPLAAQTDYFGGAKWIGAITRQQAHIPEGRIYQGSVLKDTKTEWEKADPLSRRSIILRNSFKPLKPIVKAELRIAGLGFYIVADIRQT